MTLTEFKIDFDWPLTQQGNSIWCSIFDLTFHLCMTLHITFYLNSSHTVLSVPIKVHLGAEKDRLKYGVVRNIEVWIAGIRLKNFVKEFSPYQKNISNKRDVPIMWIRRIESQLYEIFYQFTFLTWVAIKSL